jgi:LysR family transcriptional regulator, low CO2-responsive transcriptional regulator
VVSLSSMDTDQLLAFQRVVREGSFTRAAASLGIGQPAVSARIQALEAAVGGALFSRGRRVALTALGESFLPYARRATDVLGEGLEAARLARTGHRGRVTLGTLGSLGGGLVGPALAEVTQAFPEVEWFVRAGDHERVIELLWDGIIELGLVTWPCTEAIAADLTRLLLFHEPVVLVASPDHALARRRRCTQDELARLGRPFLQLRWWQRHHPEIVRLAQRAGTTVDVPMETARQLCLGGAAVAFFTQTYIAEDLASGALVSISVRDLAPIFRDSALVRRRRATPRLPAADALIAALRKHARSRGLAPA